MKTSADGPDREAPLCNLCGLTCQLDFMNSGGLERHTVHGNYSSTAGNGHGALDDCTSYSFSLCEWCLDWLFCQFRLPPDVRDTDIDGTPESVAIFRPAAQRVAEDEWRRKEEFTEEHARRSMARAKARDA